MKTFINSVTILVGVLYYGLKQVKAGSGYLIDPPARSSMWRVQEFSSVAPINYDDMSIDCGSGGAQWVYVIHLNLINKNSKRLKSI